MSKCKHVKVLVREEIGGGYFHAHYDHGIWTHNDTSETSTYLTGRCEAECKDCGLCYKFDIKTDAKLAPVWTRKVIKASQEIQS